MKNGWLIVSGCINDEKFNNLYHSLCVAAHKRDISLDIKKNSDFAVTSAEQKILGIEEYPDFVLFWDKDIELCSAFESAHIPVFNSAESIQLCDDKYKTIKRLSSFNIDMPFTVKVPKVYKNSNIDEFGFISEIEKTVSYPMVIKCTKGSFGKQVALAKNKEDLMSFIHMHYGEDIIIQQYISSSYGKDLRVYMVGQKCVAAMIRENSNNFRANIYLGGRGSIYQPNKIQIQLCQSIMHILNLSFGGIDFLFGKDGELLLCEVNSNAHFNELTNITGINAADSILEYIDVNT